MTSKRGKVFAGALCCLAFVLPLAGGAQEKPGAAAKAEFDRGYEAARRGYWQEANARYRRAAELQPNNAEILSNLAVSYEAMGMWEEAGEAYERALRAAPTDRHIKKNFRLYEEFVQAYVKTGPDEEAEVPTAQGGGG